METQQWCTSSSSLSTRSMMLRSPKYFLCVSDLCKVVRTPWHLFEIWWWQTLGSFKHGNRATVQKFSAMYWRLKILHIPLYLRSCGQGNGRWVTWRTLTYAQWRVGLSFSSAKGSMTMAIRIQRYRSWISFYPKLSREHRNSLFFNFF